MEVKPLHKFDKNKSQHKAELSASPATVTSTHQCTMKDEW
jgi:hypothetical protein